MGDTRADLRDVKHTQIKDGVGVRAKRRAQSASVLLHLPAVLPSDLSTFPSFLPFSDFYLSQIFYLSVSSSLGRNILYLNSNPQSRESSLF